MSLYYDGQKEYNSNSVVTIGNKRGTISAFSSDELSSANIYPVIISDTCRTCKNIQNITYELKNGIYHKECECDEITISDEYKHEILLLNMNKLCNDYVNEDIYLSIDTDTISITINADRRSYENLRELVYYTPPTIKDDMKEILVEIPLVDYYNNIVKINYTQLKTIFEYLYRARYNWFFLKQKLRKETEIEKINIIYEEFTNNKKISYLPVILSKYYEPEDVVADFSILHKG